MRARDGRRCNREETPGPHRRASRRRAPRPARARAPGPFRAPADRGSSARPTSRSRDPDPDPHRVDPALGDGEGRRGGEQQEGDEWPVEPETEEVAHAERARPTRPASKHGRQSGGRDASRRDQIADRHETGTCQTWRSTAVRNPGVPGFGYPLGNCTVTRSPPAARGVSVRRPSCAWVMLLTIARPRPTPA